MAPESPISDDAQAKIISFLKVADEQSLSPLNSQRMTVAILLEILGRLEAIENALQRKCD